MEIWERDYAQEKNAAAIAEQLKWIAERGGDLEGYRRHYAAALRDVHDSRAYRVDQDCDDIYYADINRLRELQGHPKFLIDQEEAVRVLGEGFFE
jgi:hypothetical protein